MLTKEAIAYAELGRLFREETADFARKKSKCNPLRSFECGNSCQANGRVCWSELSEGNKVAVKKLQKQLKQAKKNQSPPAKKRSFDSSYKTFEEEYKSERRSQELRGVVAIKTSTMRGRMVDRGFTEKEFNDLFNEMKTKGKVFTVVERNDELMQIAE